MAPADQPSPLVLDEGHLLISSARVEGTPVFDIAGEKIGTIHSIMIDKRSGRAAYAVLSFGGFLGIGSRVHPIPWAALEYNDRYHGYCVALSREELENAPTLRLDEADRPTDRAYDERLLDYYGATQFWGT